MNPINDMFSASAALIFDLDGTLVDNMEIHAEAFAEFVRRHRLPPFTPELRRRLDGKRNRDIFPILFDRQMDGDELARVTFEKESLYRTLSAGRIRPLAGLDLLLDLADARGIPVAVATSAPAENVTHTLAEIGLVERFPVVVRSDDVPRGKPFPDVFLEAAKRIGVPPDQCTAFEDAPAGIDAARAAGMRTVAVSTGFSREILGAHGPVAVIGDYHEFMKLA